MTKTATAPQAKPATRPASRLATLKPKTLDEPLRHLLYGAEGVGKSSLAARAPNPIFFDCEGGSGRVLAVRYPFRDDADGHRPRSMDEIYAGIDELMTSEHEFQTLVIDTVDALEALVWKRCCDRYSGSKNSINKNGKALESIEDFGFAKGYIVAVDEWRLLCSALDRLRSKRGMTIVLLGHSVIRTFKNPLGDDYDRIQLRVHDKAAGFLKEWADVVGYCAFDEGGAPLSDGDLRAKAWSSGKRMIHFERSGAFDAKTRIPLPKEIEMKLDDPWGPFAAALEEGRHTTPDKLIDLINAELDRIGDPELRTKVREESVKVRHDTATLSRYLNKLRDRQPVAV